MAFNSQAVMTPYRINGINMINVPLGKDSNSMIDIPCEKNIISPLRLVYHHSYSFWKYFMIFSHWGQFYKHLLNSWWLYVVIYVVIHPRFSTLTCNPNGPATRPRSYAPSRATPWFWQMIWSKPPVVWERLAETVGGDGWMWKLSDSSSYWCLVGNFLEWSTG